MGVVYKAEDTTLDRPVALKFLADHLLNDTEAKERFLREAKAAAALHHPNVCPVYEIAEASGKTFIAMAFLEGESLEDRIAKGPLPIKDALDIARQVAEGLQAAHAKGIVHRDIKPANILVSPEGRPTIMDFGLARLTEASRLTKVDTAMGTVAYMSPEQAQGMEVDSRTDIWALGCVLYEMVAGQRPFQGQYDQALLYEIVHEEPAALTGLRSGVPLELELLVGKCLAKDREDRPESAREVARELRTLSDKLKSGRSTILRTGQMTGAVPATMTGAHTVNPAAALPPDAVIVRRTHQRVLQAGAAAATLAFLVVTALYLTQDPPPAPEKLVRRFSFSQKYLDNASISPDGKYVAYRTGTGLGTGSIWIRSLATESSRELEDTEGARFRPFWSPDSKWVGFAAGGDLKKVSIDGGTPLTLGQLPSERSAFLGGTWSPDGERIVFSSGLRLYQAPARGGASELLFDPSGDLRPGVIYPDFLPAGGGPHALVYTAATSPSDEWLAVMNLETGERNDLGPGSMPFYSDDGYLIHGPTNELEDGLWALPFSRQTMKASGQDFPITTVGAVASVSREGTLVFGDKFTDVVSTLRSLVWRDRRGNILEKAGQPQVGLREIELSPDGRFVAASVAEPSDIWIQDLTRSTISRVTFGPEGEFIPRWTPSGKEVVYSAEPAPNRMMRVSADGSSEPVEMLARSGNSGAADWSPDGRYIAFHGLTPDSGTSNDLFYVEIDGEGKAGEVKTFLSTAANETAVQFSPDGRLLAYVSNESGRTEVYLRPFPTGAGRWQVSVNGGAQPRWRKDGKELFYVEDRTSLMAVPVGGGQTPTLGTPEQLFESEDLAFRSSTWPMYDVSADGQRFLTATPDEEPPPPSVRIVENWYEEFRDREQ